MSEWRAVNYYTLYLAVTHEEDGRWSATAKNLPGCGSCGDTREEAIANAKEAAEAVIAAYGESGEPAPWKRVDAA